MHTHPPHAHPPTATHRMHTHPPYAQVDSSVLTSVHVSSQVSTDDSPVELTLKTTTVEELSTEETVYSSMDDNLHMLQVNVTQADTQTEVVSSGIQPAVEVSETGVCVWGGGGCTWFRSLEPGNEASTGNS